MSKTHGFFFIFIGGGEKGDKVYLFNSYIVIENKILQKEPISNGSTPTRKDHW